MSTGMRKWMEKDCPETEGLSAQVLIDREELKQLRADLETYKAERDALRAKVEAMERQEPVAKVRVHRTGGNAGLAWSVAPLNDFDSLPLMRDGDRLYALPGAQPAPDGWKLVPIEVVGLYTFMCAAFIPMTPQQEQIAVQLELAKRAMLAAAPEVKP